MAKREGFERGRLRRSALGTPPRACAPRGFLRRVAPALRYAVRAQQRRASREKAQRRVLQAGNAGSHVDHDARAISRVATPSHRHYAYVLRSLERLHPLWTPRAREEPPFAKRQAARLDLLRPEVPAEHHTEEGDLVPGRCRDAPQGDLEEPGHLGGGRPAPREVTLRWLGTGTVPQVLVTSWLCDDVLERLVGRIWRDERPGDAPKAVVGGQEGATAGFDCRLDVPACFRAAGRRLSVNARAHFGRGRKPKWSGRLTAVDAKLGRRRRAIDDGAPPVSVRRVRLVVAVIVSQDAWPDDAEEVLRRDLAVLVRDLEPLEVARVVHGAHILLDGCDEHDVGVEA